MRLKEKLSSCKRIIKKGTKKMRMSVLASGSTGNAVYVEDDEQAFLIDAGLSGKKIEEKLAAIGRSMEKVNGIFVTHEHSDHIHGVGVLARRHHVPVYANEKTWQAMRKDIGKIPSDLEFRFDPETDQLFGDFQIQSFRVSHDAVDPMFFALQHGNRKLSIITDTGYMNDRMKGHIRGSDAFVFETNHDVSLLQMCGYPWSVKRRILSDVGHMSNEDAAVAMSEVVEEKETKIYLSHLSRDNNMKDLARMSVSQTLETFGIRTGEFIHLFDTDEDEPTKLIDV